MTGQTFEADFAAWHLEAGFEIEWQLGQVATAVEMAVEEVDTNETP